MSLNEMLDALDAKVKAATPGPWLACSLGTDEGRNAAKGRTCVAGTHRQEGIVTLADSGGTRPASDARLIASAVNAAPVLIAIVRAAAKRPWWRRNVPDAFGERGKECSLCGAWSPHDIDCGASHGWIGGESSKTHRMCDMQPIDAALDRAEAEAANE